MRLFVCLSIFLATLPVLGLNLAPKPGEDVLAIFKADTDDARLVQTALEQGLNVVSYDQELKHLIVKDDRGTSSKALYALGASLVLDADFLSLCNPEGRNPRSLS